MGSCDGEAQSALPSPPYHRCHCQARKKYCSINYVYSQYWFYFGVFITSASNPSWRRLPEFARVWLKPVLDQGGLTPHFSSSSSFHHHQAFCNETKTWGQSGWLVTELLLSIVNENKLGKWDMGQNTKVMFAPLFRMGYSQHWHFQGACTVNVQHPSLLLLQTIPSYSKPLCEELNFLINRNYKSLHSESQTCRAVTAPWPSVQRAISAGD